MIPDHLVQRIADRPNSSGRFVVAIAGPPAAGKTTMATALHDAVPTSAVLGLDAFHYDDAILAARSQRQRKGAPFTFDVQGYRRCLESLRCETKSDVAIPVFDRELELSRNCAQVVPASCEVIITEGNYLLLDQGDWPSVAPLFDLTVFLDVDVQTVRDRIIQRWRHHGLTAGEALVRADENDLPNAELVLAGSRSPDLVIGRP